MGRTEPTAVSYQLGLRKTGLCARHDLNPRSTGSVEDLLLHAVPVLITVSVVVLLQCQNPALPLPTVPDWGFNIRYKL